jgi:polysaccharide biosynthesis protein PslH
MVERILSVRILFVTPYVPSRIRVRPFNLIKLLSPMHEISLVSLLVEDYEREMVKDVEPYCVSVDLVPLPKWQAYANCLLALPTLTPLRVAYYRSPAFAQRIKEVILRQNIDVVHGELIKVVPALKAVLASANIPILYDSVDCISWLLQQQLETTRNPLKKAFVYSELQKMRRYEQRALVDFHQLIINALSDRDYLLSALPQGAINRAPPGQAQHIEVVSNGVDIDYFACRDGPRVVDSLVFCAKLDYFPNAQAILHFCEQTLPLLWKYRPQVRLTIVGNNPPQSVRALTLDERITVTGYVPDTRPYLGAASVVVAPLLVAAGMQNKVLEALSMGMPIVTTPRCSRVIGVEDGKHLLVAEGPQAFAGAIVKLLDDPQLAQRLGKAGRQFVVEHYSWPDAVDTLVRLYNEIALTARQQQPAMDSPSYSLS